MIMKKGSRRFVSAVLLIAMLVTSFASVPSVFAEETDADSEQIQEEVLEAQETEGEETETETEVTSEEGEEPEPKDEEAATLQEGAGGEHAQNMTLDANAEDLKLTMTATTAIATIEKIPIARATSTNVSPFFTISLL